MADAPRRPGHGREGTRGLPDTAAVYRPLTSTAQWRVSTDPSAKACSNIYVAHAYETGESEVLLPSHVRSRELQTLTSEKYL